MPGIPAEAKLRRAISLVEYLQLQGTYLHHLSDYSNPSAQIESRYRTPNTADSSPPMRNDKPLCSPLDSSTTPFRYVEAMTPWYCLSSTPKHLYQPEYEIHNPEYERIARQSFFYLLMIILLNARSLSRAQIREMPVSAYIWVRKEPTSIECAVRL